MIIDYNPQTDSILSVSIRFPQNFYPTEKPVMVLNEMIYSDLEKQLEAKYGKTMSEDSFSTSNIPGEDPYISRSKIWEFPDGKIALQEEVSLVVRTSGVFKVDIRNVLNHISGVLSDRYRIDICCFFANTRNIWMIFIKA